MRVVYQLKLVRYDLSLGEIEELASSLTKLRKKLVIWILHWHLSNRTKLNRMQWSQKSFCQWPVFPCRIHMDGLTKADSSRHHSPAFRGYSNFQPISNYFVAHMLIQAFWWRRLSCWSTFMMKSSLDRSNFRRDPIVCFPVLRCRWEILMMATPSRWREGHVELRTLIMFRHLNTVGTKIWKGRNM